MKAIVEVYGDRYEIDLWQHMKTVRHASGSVDGRIIRAKGRSENSAIEAWRHTVELKKSW